MVIMCGIYFCSISAANELDSKQTSRFLRHKCLKQRGPDAYKAIIESDYFAAFYRLAIVGLENGMQPFMKDDVIMMCNGEIYNCVELENHHDLDCKTGSDCECILQLYLKYGIDYTVDVLNGEFAFVLYDRKKQMVFFARDRLGRKPLFYSHDGDELDVCSLYSGLEFTDRQQVVPGVLYNFNTNAKKLSQIRYHQFFYKPDNLVGRNYNSRDVLFQRFTDAVCTRIEQTERPIGFLLSGGFDSSAVLSVALDSGVLKSAPHVFTFGFSDQAPDVLSAELMVNWLKKKYGDSCVVWHKVIMSLHEGLDALPVVVNLLETYDTTTIRASTPMYLISKYISKNTDVKVLLSGEGSDELFGGYLYFKYAPDDYAFRAEIIKRLEELYLYDVLRADRTTAECGLEVRTPFLDDDFVEYILRSRQLTRCTKNTKELIRDVFASRNLLPDEILQGKKEAFSDAVGHSWKEAIAEFAESEMKKHSDESLSPGAHIKAETYEMQYFQMLFDVYYPESWHLLPALWLPNQDWVTTGVEPSARVLSVYHMDVQKSVDLEDVM
jgi:asparagine synthase (glutamine-hydrolysing)